MKFAFTFLLILIQSCTYQSFESVKKINPSSFVEILDREGKLLHEDRRNFKVQRRSWVALKELPPDFIQELLTFEDKRFYQHLGVDPLAILNSVKNYPKRGASTISMQLASRLEGKTKGIRGKILQSLSALKLELSWTKDQILEAYINLIGLRGELQGLRAASLQIFRKEPWGLTQEERLLIFAMIPSPNQNSERLVKRACTYSKMLKRTECNLTSVLEASYFHSESTPLRSQLTPHLATKLNRHQEKIQTTLDKPLQEEAFRLLLSHLSQLKHQNVSDGAILVVERKTGKVLAYVGSSGDLSSSPHVDHVQALRQAGSTLKPFLYAQAIEKRLITMTTKLEDAPFSITREGLTYQPENYQKSFTYQDVPAKVALGSSLNIPAIRVIDLLTPNRFYELLKELEFTDLASEEYYGHSMALGSVDVSLWDLTRAYGALADGILVEPIFLGQKTKTKIIPTFNAEISSIISTVLSEKENRHMTFGIQSTLSTDSWSAVKTGTSKDMRDNWCVGYTDRYLLGVWVGNSSGSPMWNVSGITGAAPIFSSLVSFLHQKNPSIGPAIPKGLVQVKEDFYLAGTEPKGTSFPDSSPLITKILFPQQGAQFAFDPEIPSAHQRLYFESSTHKGIWKLDGKILSPAEISNGFLPEKKSKHTLELWEGESKKDEITFSVKAGRRPHL